MKTILVALDGSSHANKALELATDIAAKYEAKLVLLTVIDNRPLTDAERRLAQSEYADRIQSRMSTADLTDAKTMGPRGLDPLLGHMADTSLVIRTVLGEGVLGEATAHAKAKGVGDIEKRLQNGDPAEQIIKAARDCDANLIVLGSRGHSDLKSLFLGSVSHKVANLADVNVITVK